MLASRTTVTRTPSFLPLPSFILRQISSSFSTFNEMAKNNNKATKSSQADPLMSQKPLSDTSHDNKACTMVGSNPVPLHHNNIKNQLLPLSAKSSALKNPELMSRSDHLPSPPTTTDSECREFKRKSRVDLRSVQVSGDNCGGKSSFSSTFESTSSHSETLPTTNFTSHHDESLQHGHFGKKAAFASRQYNSYSNLNYAAAGHKLDSSVSLPKFEPFDICFHRKRNYPTVGSPLLEKAKESCIEIQEEGSKQRTLRPGMVLLKRYIAHDEQVEIVKICRELGLGPGGFYQPGYADGAKLRLQMMCLGLDWDPQTRKYGNKRVVDCSEPPSIPNHFSKLVLRAIQQAHYLINKQCGVSYVEDILPSMSPDICIVNFYTTYGRLGLHQDRDESRESLRKGLPVVSFSVGDSAEFLYGDQRDVKKAENVLLESGDVLIFGGESRHVFHGVSSIIPHSAPNELLKDSSLRPGRLNLTFRQY